MATDGPNPEEPNPAEPNPSNPFAAIPLFGELFRSLAQQGGPGGLDNALPLAISMANGGPTSEANVDPLLRIRLAELARIAELHLEPYMSASASTGPAPTIVPTTRAQWVQRALEDYKPLFHKLSGSLGKIPPTPADDPEMAALNSMFGPLMQLVGPLMMTMTSAGMVGNLARRALGTYHLPIPRPRAAGGAFEIQLVAEPMASFADDWSLDADSVHLWCCLHELTTHAALSNNPLADALSGLLVTYCGAFEPNSDALSDRLGDFDPMSLLSGQTADESGASGGLGGLEKLFGDPEMLLGAVRSPAQTELGAQIEVLVGVVIGWVDHVLDQVAPRLLGNAERLTEALRRRRVEASDSDRFVERLFGLRLDQALCDRGEAFVKGVVERGGEPQLARLWTNAKALPTRAEFEAPGLWLARLEYLD